MNTKDIKDISELSTAISGLVSAHYTLNYFKSNNDNISVVISEIAEREVEVDDLIDRVFPHAISPHAKKLKDAMAELIYKQDIAISACNIPDSDVYDGLVDEMNKAEDEMNKLIMAANR